MSLEEKRKPMLTYNLKSYPGLPKKIKVKKNQHDPPNHLSDHLSLSLLSHLKTEKFGKKFTPLPQKKQKTEKTTNKNNPNPQNP